MPKRRVAFLTDADTPGPFKHMPKLYELNSVESIAHAIDADADFECAVWLGRELTEQMIQYLAAVDFVIINLKHTLWRTAIRLAQVLKRNGARPLLFGYQEGPADLAALLPPPQAERYIAAHSGMDGILCYDLAALPWFRGMTLRPAHYLPLPAALEAYDHYRLPPARRWNAVHISPMLSDQRGGLMSLSVANDLGAKWVVLRERDVRNLGIAAELASSPGQAVYARGWTQWSRMHTDPVGRPPADEYAPPCFLETLARCQVAVNLDTSACYGRFVVDCAGLGVPCIGSRRNAMQPILFPTLTFDPWKDVEHAVRAGRELLADPKRRDQIASSALDTLRRQFSPEAHRRRWRIIARQFPAPTAQPKGGSE